MKYEIDIYKNNPKNTLRFLLGKSGKKPIFIIGLNPSTANENKSDPTMTKIIRFLELNNYDSFIMLNLYPQRTSDPSKLDSVINHKYHKENLQIIKSHLQNFSKVDVLSAWGEKILLRDYLKVCLIDIKESFNDSKPKWWQIGDLTKSGHPRHPSRAAYRLKFAHMNIEDYIINLK